VLSVPAGTPPVPSTWTKKPRQLRAEGLENGQAVLSVRVPAALAETLKARAAEEHVPTSALIRRILVRAVRAGTTPVLTVEQVEEIARRVMRESA
jgi:hypothetical protein